MVTPTELVQNTIETAKKSFLDSITKPKDAEIYGANFQGYLTLFNFGGKAYVTPGHKLDLREVTQKSISDAVVRDYGNGPAISGYGSGGPAMFFIYGNSGTINIHYLTHVPVRSPLPEVRGEEAKRVLTAVGLTIDTLYWPIFVGRIKSEEERVKLLKEHGFEDADIKEAYKKLVSKQQELVKRYKSNIARLKEEGCPHIEQKEGLEQEQQRLELMLQA